ncbi:MAG TPA: 50S ribosomal protein L29 [Alphaproteobacteria bacterium]|nr:50S ribosomal protein L29 [Alphaproteobacteria bacterium]
MKQEDLRGKTIDQLQVELVSLKKESFNLRFQQVNGQLQNSNRIRVVRRQAARVLTFLNQQQTTKK